MIKADLAQFNRALKSVAEISKRDDAYIVNKALKDVAFRAMGLTPKADPGQIERELLKDQIALKIAAKMLAGRRGKERVDRQGNTKLSKSGKAMRYSRKVSRRQIAAAARALIRRRKNSRGYQRAGWIPSVKLFGGSLRGEKAKSSFGQLGSATKATISKLSGEIVNRIYDKMDGKAGAQSKARMEAALIEAIAFVAADRGEFARKKKEATLQRFSDK